MSPFDPVLNTLPAEIAIFPLGGALLLPAGRLPLNIFEPRYLAMVEDSLGAGRMFGMIQPDRAASPGPEDATLFHVGCLGRLSSFSETDDGRYLITLNGVIRYRLVEELPERRGYRRARVAYGEFAADLAPQPLELGGQRAHILAALRDYFSHRGLDANWESISQMPDHALLTTLCMACPFEPAEKQALLEAPTDTDRAATLLTLLRFAAHDPDDGADEPPKRNPS
jgi:Lon protease-like protein